MRLLLEREDCRFLTTYEQATGDLRWLVVDFHGKRFYVHRNCEICRFHDDGYRKSIEARLIEEMELMLEGIFLNALQDVEAGMIPMRCKTGEIWRNHFEGRCQCEMMKKVNTWPANSGGKL